MYQLENKDRKITVIIGPKILKSDKTKKDKKNRCDKPQHFSKKSHMGL